VFFFQFSLHNVFFCNCHCPVEEKFFSFFIFETYLFVSLKKLADYQKCNIFPDFWVESSQAFFRNNFCVILYRNVPVPKYLPYLLIRISARIQIFFNTTLTVIVQFSCDIVPTPVPYAVH
jgi:hypothetical protein